MNRRWESLENKIKTGLCFISLMLNIHAFSFDGNGSYDVPYLIQNSEDLIELADSVNKGSDFEGVFFLQTENIDMAKLVNWTPIGSTKNKFEGHYDGSLYTIENIVLTGEIKEEIGLFGCVGSKGVIENVTIRNIKISNAVRWCGGVCATNEGTIKKCNSEICDITSYQIIGAIVGVNFGKIIECSSNEGYVFGAICAGGIVGYNYGEVSDCENTGRVVGAVGSGGICGYNGGFDRNLYCKDTDEFSLSTVRDCENNGGVYGEKYAGGICGRNDGDLMYSINWGKVEADWYAGGITGANGNINDVESVVKNVVNKGAVMAREEVSAGICGLNLANGMIDSVVNYGLVFEKNIEKGMSLTYQNDGNISNAYWLKNEYSPIFIDNGIITNSSCFDIEKRMCDDVLSYVDVEAIMKSAHCDDAKCRDISSINKNNIGVCQVGHLTLITSYITQGIEFLDIKGSLVIKTKMKEGEQRYFRLESGVYLINKEKHIVK